MTTEISHPLLTKIQALLRMAEHPNSNQNEAAIALERAQSLLLEHNLTRADVMTDSNNKTPWGIGKVEGVETAGFTWKARMLHVIAKANLCSVVVSSRENKWHIFGTYTNVRSVLAMWNWVCEQLEGIALREWSTYHDRGGYETVRTWKAGFFEGATSAVKDRLQKPYDTFAQGNGRALVVQSQADLDAARRKIFPRVTTSHCTGSRSYDGRASGKQAGAKVSFARQGNLNGGSLRLSSGS